ncbi:MAG: ribosome recycling factor [Firmicutes bacterium]|nr:ribosome recycling factor [Bacillota bacterium]
MIRDVLNEAENRMKGVIAATKRDFAAVRTGRANPAILDRVSVDYYGTATPITQLATVSVPEPRLITIQPWDRSVLKEIERAILQSDLGLTPVNDGQIIRLAIPPLTEERRKELARLVRKEAEDKRVAVRNIRRDTNEQLKTMQKNGKISEDEAKRAEKQTQELTDKYIKEIDALLQAKEQEIMEI